MSFDERDIENAGLYRGPEDAHSPRELRRRGLTPRGEKPPVYRRVLSVVPESSARERALGWRALRWSLLVGLVCVLLLFVVAGVTSRDGFGEVLGRGAEEPSAEQMLEDMRERQRCAADWWRFWC